MTSTPYFTEESIYENSTSTEWNNTRNENVDLKHSNKQGNLKNIKIIIRTLLHAILECKCHYLFKFMCYILKNIIL